MQSVGPVTLALNTLVTQSDPAQKVGSESVAVQVQNASIFVLNIVSAGDQYTLQPYTAQTIPVSSQPITVLPTSAPGGGTTPTSAWFIWLLHGEAPPQQDGQLTAQAIAAAIAAGQVIGTQNVTALDLNNQAFTPSVAGSTFTFVASHAYSGFLAYIGSLPGATIRAIVNNNTTGAASQNLQFGKPLDTPTYFPVPCNAGDSISIRVTANTTGIATNLFVVGVNVYTPTANFFRPDGIPMPLGLKFAETGAAGTIVAAPGALLSILVQTLTVSVDGGAATVGAVAATIGGTAANILRASSTASNQGYAQLSPEPGILLDPNTGLSLGVSGAQPINCSVTYDVVGNW